MVYQDSQMCLMLPIDDTHVPHEHGGEMQMMSFNPKTAIYRDIQKTAFYRDIQKTAIYRDIQNLRHEKSIQIMRVI